MKILKFLILIITITTLNTAAYSKDCGEIKGNIVGKLFCKVSDGIGEGSFGASNASTPEAVEDEEEGGFKLFKKPKWMKKKN